MSELYTGMDLHSGNTYVGIIEKGTRKRVFEKRVRNNLEEIVWSTLLQPIRLFLKRALNLIKVL